VLELSDFEDLADPAARAALRERGFETVVVHHPARSPRLRRLAVRLARQAEGSSGELVPVTATASLSAYALRPPAEPAP
jgi:hypothetical protein